MKKNLWKLLLLLLLVTFNVSSILLLSNLLKVDILIGILLIIVEVLITFILLRKKTKRLSRVIVGIVCIIFSLCYVIVDYSIYHTDNVIKKVTSDYGEYKVYEVVALKKSNYKGVMDLNNKSVGFLETDILMEDSVKSLKDAIDFELKKYGDISSIFNSLNNNEVNAVSIEEGMINLLEDTDINFRGVTRVIYTYKVKISDNKVIKTDTNTTQPFILYISGTDSRTGVNTVARSDVNIVTVINPGTRKILMVSIPRDYYVQLHDTTGIKDKLTHAGVYGINKSITTIEDLLNIKIDRYVKVSFDTVKRTVDLIDGIDIDSDIDFKAWTNKSCKFYKGIQHVNGTCALAFARERKSYLMGDRHRGENQEQVITKILDKVTEPKYLLKYNQLLDITKDTFHTNMSRDEIVSFVGNEYQATTKWQVETYNLDGEGTMLPTYSMGSMNLWVMIPDESTIEMAKVKINEYLSNE